MKSSSNSCHRVNFRILITALITTLVPFGLAGCGMPRNVIEATASLPPEMVKQGTMYQIYRSGGVQLGYNGAGIGFDGVRIDEGQPAAHLFIGSNNQGQSGPADVYLKLGESREFAGIGQITIVSFDNAQMAQAITILVIRE